MLEHRPLIPLLDPAQTRGLVSIITFKSTARVPGCVNSIRLVCLGCCCVLVFTAFQEVQTASKHAKSGRVLESAQLLLSLKTKCLLAYNTPEGLGC